MNAQQLHRGRGPLADLIRRHYGAQTILAQDLGVTNQTVTNWIKTRPAAIMKHAATIAASDRGITISDLLEAVEAHEKHLER